jgi:excinuclease UvrABC nuclease subunit
MRSILAEIPGFGPKSRKKLLEKFSSYEEILNTADEVIFEKTGINRKLILEIKKTLEEKKVSK